MKAPAGHGLILTHQNLLDGTAEGVACLPDKLFSFPCSTTRRAHRARRTAYLFKRFIDLMEGGEEACLSARIFTVFW